MRVLFKEKISKFGSLVSLVALTAMLAVFSLALPEFLSSTTGRIFSAVWALLAIGVFVAHATRLSVQKTYMLPHLAGKKDARTVKENGKDRTNRMMRG